MLLIDVILLLFRVLSRSNNLFQLIFSVHSLQVIDLKAGMRGQEPPPAVFAEEGLAVIPEFPLPSPHFLHVVDISLIIFDGFQLLLKQFPGKHCEESPFHESSDRGQKSVWVIFMPHVLLWILWRKQEVKRKAHQQTKVDWRQENVNYKLHEVLVIFLPHAIIEPPAVVIHFEDTSFAFRAVVGSFWLPLVIAFLTDIEPCSIHVVRQLNIVGNHSWICKRSSDVRQNRQVANRVE